MAETYPQQVERLEHEKRLPSGEELALAGRIEANARNAEQNPSVNPEEALRRAEAAAESQPQASLAEKLQGSETPAAPAVSVRGNRDLEQVTKQRSFNQIRRNLNPVDRSLSKVIHTPAVRVVSEAAGKTVSRPSGLLGGGIVALLGTSVYLYLAKHLGFEYNYLVFLLLFVGGFAIGLVLEFFVFVATRGHKAKA